MAESVLIIACSLVLLVYWFRYSCILILRAEADPARAGADEDARFSVGEVQRRLEYEQELDPLHSSLRRDYDVLIYLVEHASGLELSSIEDRLLVLDYKLMQCWYRLAKTMFPDQARKALAEMASVLGVLIHRMDEHSAVRPSA